MIDLSWSAGERVRHRVKLANHGSTMLPHRFTVLHTIQWYSPSHGKYRIPPVKYYRPELGICKDILSVDILESGEWCNKCGPDTKRKTGGMLRQEAYNSKLDLSRYKLTKWLTVLTGRGPSLPLLSRLPTGELEFILPLSDNSLTTTLPLVITMRTPELSSLICQQNDCHYVRKWLWWFAVGVRWDIMM